MIECPIFWNKKYLDSFEQKSIFLSSDPNSQSVTDIFKLKTSKLLETESLLLSGQISKNRFTSSSISSFGGVYSTHKNKIDTFIVNSINFLTKNHGINSFKFTLPPDHISDFNQKIQIQSLLDIGFNISLIEINYAIELRFWSIGLMSKGNQKKLKQGDNNNFVFEQIEFQDLASVYDLLKANRMNLGVKLSTDLPRLSVLLESFPDKYFLFGVFYQGNLIAASVCVETFTSNLYVFYWGDDLNFRHFSPVTFLANGIIEFAKSRNYDFLDLGTVGPNGTYSETLAKYKQNLGATLSFKYCLELN
jgi:hypothetical protein